MKLYVLVLLLLVTFLLAGYPPAAFAADQAFTIVNATDSDIAALSIAPSGNAESPNAIKGKVLPSGQSIQVVFPNYNPVISQWDILGITCCGDTLKWQQLNLSAAATIILRESGLAELK